MIARLAGTTDKTNPGSLVLDVGGVGYGVQVPLDDWDALPDQAQATLWVHSYIREDRFELYGFTQQSKRTLFVSLIDLPGIGPKIALEICAVPGAVLQQAVGNEDSKLLTSIKGVGKKMAEKLLIELQSLYEKHPDIVQGTQIENGAQNTGIDSDAIAALQNLGYDQVTIIKTLSTLPEEMATTEERVTAALRSM